MRVDAFRTVLAAALLTAAGACDRPPGGPVEVGRQAVAGRPLGAKVEFTLTARELAEAYDADPDACRAKYAGKRVELTGTVQTVRLRARPTDNDVMLRGVIKPKSFLAGYVVFGIRPKDADKYESLAALAKGQEVTVRGVAAGYGMVVADCEFVNVGPSPALPVTPSELKAAFATEDGQKKYNDKAVVTRGEVRKAEWNGTVATLTLADVGQKDGPTLEASVNPMEKEVGEQVGKIKPGTVVVVIGDGDNANDGRIWNARVLAAPPEGVKLPGDKK